MRVSYSGHLLKYRYYSINYLLGCDQSVLEMSGHDTQEQQPANKNKKRKTESNLPLFQRLKQSLETEAVEEDEDEGDKDHQHRIKRRKSAAQEEDNPRIGRAHKNAPAEMPSDRPVRRLRVTADNSTKKIIDPRFSDVSGKLDDKIFSKDYSFLDDYKEDEIKKLSGVLKKVKTVMKRDEIKAELVKMKQQFSERKRGLQVASRLDQIKSNERAKVKEGKQPFYLKKSAMKELALEEKFNELKKNGKLNKFMEKKRKKNASKDRRWLPDRRSDNSDNIA